MALRPLSRVKDFTFPEQAWDVRGWTVRTEVGDEKVGKVDDMLLDHTGGLRYLDVDLGFLKKHVLVPLDHAHADRETQTVRIEGMTREGLESVPEYALDPESLNEDYERRLDKVYGGTRASSERGLLAPDLPPDGELELRRMSDLEDEYRVAGDDPRGWSVVTGEGRRVGQVAELLMEPGAMRARFLDVAADEKELELEPVDRHILIPAERVRLDRGKKKVVVSGLLGSDIAEYPQYGGLPLTHRAARSLHDVFERVGTRGADGDGDRWIRDEPPGDWRDATLGHFYSPRRTHRTREDEHHG